MSENRRKERYEALKSRGFCVACGQRPRMEGHVRCEICEERFRASLIRCMKRNPVQKEMPKRETGKYKLVTIKGTRDVRLANKERCEGCIYLRPVDHWYAGCHYGIVNDTVKPVDLTPCPCKDTETEYDILAERVRRRWN